MEHFIFILMITGISASLSTSITRRMTLADKSVRECDKEGLMCRDCSTLVYCQKDGLYFKPIVVSTCSKDVPCDETKTACTAGGACRYKEFVCPYNLPKDQFLPDPYTCSHYWWCKSGDALLCDAPSAYNPISTECDLLMQNSPFCLHDPLPPCEYNGQKLNIEGTPFNYECQQTLPQEGNYPIIYPYLLLNSTNPTTSPNPTTPTNTPKPTNPTNTPKPTNPTNTPKPTNPTNTPKPTNPTSTPKPTNPTDSPTTTDLPFICPSAGYFPHKTDCTKYYKCVLNSNGTFTQTLLQCRVGSYFDDKTKKCVRGNCTKPPRL